MDEEPRQSDGLDAVGDPAQSAEGAPSVAPGAGADEEPPAAAKRPPKCRWILAVFWAVTLVLVLATGLMIYRIATRPAPEPEPPGARLADVETVRVEPREYIETLSLPARLEADRTVVLSSELQARLQTWLVGEGEKVRANQELLRLNSDDLQAKRKELEAALEAARVRRDYAVREHERLRRLAEENIASDSDLDAAATARREAEVAVKQTQRQLASLSVTLAKSVIRAPFAGSVDEHLAEVGSVVAPGQPLLRLYDLRHCRVQVDVPDRYLPFLQEDNAAIQEYIRHAMPGGEPVRQASFLIPGLPKLTGGHHRGVRLPAIVYRLAQTADPASNTFRVELRLENPGGALRGGMLGRAEIQFLRYPEAIVVPLRSIRVTDRGPRAVVVEKREKREVAAVRSITPVSIQRDRVLIQDGLRPGDRLIVSGQQGLVDGEEVRVLKANGAIRREAMQGEEAAFTLPEDYQPAQPETDGDKDRETGARRSPPADTDDHGDAGGAP